MFKKKLFTSIIKIKKKNSLHKVRHLIVTSEYF